MTTEVPEKTPFDDWWEQFGKAILNRHHCAEAAWKEAKTVRVHDVDEFYPEYDPWEE